jgi:SUMO ligase MMS21 Smc5/6 complex component
VGLLNSRGLKLRVMAASGTIPLGATFYCLKVSCQPDLNPILIVRTPAAWEMCKILQSCQKPTRVCSATNLPQTFVSDFSPS